jgi:hypothetical protein
VKIAWRFSSVVVKALHEDCWRSQFGRPANLQTSLLSGRRARVQAHFRLCHQYQL